MADHAAGVSQEADACALDKVISLSEASTYWQKKLFPFS
jgi:hypothetical protein